MPINRSTNILASFNLRQRLVHSARDLQHIYSYSCGKKVKSSYWHEISVSVNLSMSEHVPLCSLTVVRSPNCSFLMEDLMNMIELILFLLLSNSLRGWRNQSKANGWSNRGYTQSGRLVTEVSILDRYRDEFPSTSCQPRWIFPSAEDSACRRLRGWRNAPKTGKLELQHTAVEIL